MGFFSGLTAAVNRCFARIESGNNREGTEYRRLFLLQFCNFIAIGAMFFFAVLYIAIDRQILWPVALLSAACIPFYLLSTFLNCQGFAQSAKILFFSVFSGSILISTGGFLGKAPGMHFFFLLAAVLPLLIWRLNRPFWVLFFMTANIGGFLCVHFRDDQTGIRIPDFPARWLLFFNAMAIIAVYSVTMVILAFFQKQAEEDALNLKDRAKKMEELVHQFEELSNTDTLTGLHNRRSMLSRMEQERIRMNRFHSGFATVICDIDFFKTVNDTHGHEAGDKVLVEIGRILQTSLREVDFVARWGGEEFLILLPDTTAEGAAVVAEKIRRRVEEEAIAWADRKINCTVTLGIALYDTKHSDLNRVIRQADDALYQGKREGRNRVIAHRDRAPAP